MDIDMLAIYITALTIGFSGAMMPGSLLTYTLKQSLAAGKRAGFVIVAGHALLELLLLILIFLGFDAVLRSDYAQISIGLVGGALLLFMGYDMIRGAVKNTLHVKTDGVSSKSGSLLLSGAVLSASNPFFLIWWAIVGLGLLTEAYKAFGIAGVCIFYIGHISADFIWYGTISVIVGTTRKFIPEKPYRIMIALLGGVLLFFGGRFMYSAIATASQFLI